MLCWQNFKALEAMKAGECGPRCKRGSEAEEHSPESKIFNLRGSRRSYTKMAGGTRQPGNKQPNIQTQRTNPSHTRGKGEVMQDDRERGPKRVSKTGYTGERPDFQNKIGSTQETHNTDSDRGDMCSAFQMSLSP